MSLAPRHPLSAQVFTRQDVLMVVNVCVASVCLSLTLGTGALLAWRVHRGACLLPHCRSSGGGWGWLGRP